MILPNFLYSAEEWVRRPKMGFTGTRTPPKDVLWYVKDLVLQLPLGTIVVQGACIGIDAFVGEEAFHAGYWVHSVLPSNRRQVAPDWQQWSTTYEEMEPGTSFRERDQRIVDLSEALMGFPLYPEKHPKSIRSGTWMTLRMGDRAKIPVKKTVLSELNISTQPQ